MASTEQSYHLHGRITHADGREASDAEVVLWWQRLRERIRLAEGRTSEEGRYRLHYAVPEDAPGRVLLVLEAAGGGLAGTLRSEPTPAAPDLIIDLAAPSADPSEYGALHGAVTPQLRGLPLTDVVEDDTHHDISFLALETGRGQEQIMRLVVSARLEQARGIPAAAFYAFLAARVPSSLPTSLLLDSHGFTLIDPLVARVGTLIVGLSSDQQTSTLDAAVQDGVIGPQIAAGIPDIVQRLQAGRQSDTLDAPYLAGKTTLRDLLDAAALAPAKQAALVAALTQNTDRLERFWSNLADGTHGFTAAEVTAVRRTLAIGAFVKNTLPLVTALGARFTDGTYTSLPELARLTEQDWLDLITARGPGAVPANIVGAGGASPAATFAREIHERITRAYPTAALAARIGDGGIVPAQQQAPLQAFMANNAALDLRRQNLDAYLASMGQGAFQGVAAADQPAVVANLRAFQRVLRIVPHIATCQALLRLGIASSAAIAVQGKQQFVARLAAAGVSRLDAYKTFYLAEQRYAGVVSLFTQFNRGLTGPWPNALGPQAPLDDPIQAALEKNPSLATLFGSQDYCEVDFCTSILSPAAYLTDLLLWLGQRVSGIAGFASARDALFARRADLGTLLLDCPNTDTPMPYIDLVNELLEDLVAKLPPPDAKQTTLSTAELRAAPDPSNANPGAYVALKAASYPHALPYDAALDQLRAVLAQSNVALWQLRQAFRPVHGAVPPAQAAAIAGERFAISLAERTLITTANAVPLAVAWNTPTPITDLAPVDAFLLAADLTYEQLLELCDVAWARGGGAALAITSVDDTCDTSTQTIAPLDANRLDLLHRFLRLWRRTGWKMWELDLLLSAAAVGDPALVPQTVVNLFTVRLIEDATSLPAVQVLAFFQPLDTAAHRDPDGSTTTPLYAGLFQNPAAAPDPLLALAALDGSADLATHTTAIQAALQIPAADAATLIALTDNTRTLANLSLIFRVATLARVLRLRLADMFAIGPQPPATFSTVFATPAATLAFLQRAATIARAGFSVDQLTYVLSTSPAKSGITDTVAVGVLGDVRGAIKKVNDSVFASTDPPFTVLGKQLAQLPPTTDATHPSLSDPTQLAEALSIVDGSFTGGEPARSNFITAQFGAFMTPAELAAALAGLPPNAPPGTPITVRATLDPRANLVLLPLARSLTQTQVVAAVAGDLALATDVTWLLMSTLTVPHVPAVALTLLAALTDATLIAPGAGGFGYAQTLTPVNFPDQFNAIRLLHKESVVIAQLHLVRADLAWLLANAAVYGGVDLTVLPVVAGQPAQSIDVLLQTVLLVQLDRGFNVLAGSTASPPPAIASLTDLIAAAGLGTLPDDAHAAAALAAISGAQADDVLALATTLGVTLAAGDYQKPPSFDRLRTLLAMAAATGGSGAALAAWGIEAADESSAAVSAAQALKSRYGNDAWLAAAPAIMDPLREHRRDALVAYLTARRDALGKPLAWGTDSNGLFDYLLIDTEMSACMDTTRIVQAYAAVQLFVQRCLMNLEAAVAADPAVDDGWLQWNWMKRYRLWEANRKIFLWPENWLIEADRPNRSEIFDALDQEAHQQQATAANLEGAVLNYVGALDEIAHLRVTGTCEDPVTNTIHVVAATHADPPRYYHRSFATNVWTPWTRIPIDIKAHQVVPAVHRRSLYLFWVQVAMANEPQQQIPAAAPTNAPANSTPPARHAELSVGFSTWRNGKWSGPQFAKGKLYDVPLLLLQSAANASTMAVEALYSVKTTTTAASDLLIDVFRYLHYEISRTVTAHSISESLTESTTAIHIGRATFDGRFNALELRSQAVLLNDTMVSDYLAYAQDNYGPDAEALTRLPDAAADPDLVGEPGLLPRSGALTTQAIRPGNATTIPLIFTSIAGLEQNVGPLLLTAQAPFRVIGAATDLAFDPTNYFFYRDPKRSYFVESTRYYEYGSQWRPVAPSNPGATPFEVRYRVHRFYHPYTKLFWHEIFAGDLPALYDRAVQLTPDQVDPSHGDTFSFQATYKPVPGRVIWGEDNEIVDFDPSAAYASYNWELFFHVPLYIAQQLSQNQQFEDAMSWFHFIFDPTRAGPDAAPQRFWITKPLYNLTTAAIVQERINQLLMLVNQDDADAVAAVQRWRANPFNPFLVADQRPVAYMKQVVMAYLDNLLAWADNLFATASRENLNQATLLYVLASEILGPPPIAVPPPLRAGAAFNDLLPKLDAFANAMVDIENVLPATGPGPGPGPGGGGGPMPPPHTFYFKIPPNDKLLGYWATVADRLFKLRHCENIAGQPLALPLFDAPIDPGLLAAAQAAGVDLGSVLNDLSAPLPAYRYDVLHAQAQDFCNAVRGYGAQLLAALEKRDADALALLLPTLQQQLLADANQIYQWRIDEASDQITALGQALALQQSRANYYGSRDINAWEVLGLAADTGAGIQYGLIALSEFIASGAYLVPLFGIGVAGFGGSPAADAKEGGKNAGDSFKMAAKAIETATKAVEKGASILYRTGGYFHRQDDWNQKAAEANIAAQQVTAQISAAQVRFNIATLDQTNHQTAIDNLQQQIDLLTDKFTNTALYDWMVGKLSDTYFQSYRLAYAMAKKTERCYGYELGLTTGGFISFGYWDSLHQGLLAGEALAHDIRRMHASYLDLNVRRYEISRIISLGKLDVVALITLLQTGKCNFSLPESLFDADYPGHYQRQLKRVSITVVYPSPGKNDNVTCTLTLVANKVRMNSLLNGNADPYVEIAGGNDDRFLYQYAAVQSIVTSQAQDDPGLFENQIHYQITDPRYLPFEGGGAISDWHLELPITNEIDVTTVGDVQIHLLYTALDGGAGLRAAAMATLAANAPTAGSKLFSAQNDFPVSSTAPAGTLTPWQALFAPPAATDQVLALPITAAKFPPWTRGKTITVTGLTVYAVSWTGGGFTLQPQAPLPAANVPLNPVGPAPVLVAQGAVAVTPATKLGTWAFKLQVAGAADFRSLTSSQIGDVVLKVDFAV
jgi:hypothetical protein